GVALSGTDPDDGLDRRHPDLAVADLPRAGGLHDRVDHLARLRVVDQDVDPDLGHQVDDVLGAAVHLGVALLPAEALDLAHGETLDAHDLQGRLHVIELERLDDCGDLLHADAPSVTRRVAPVAPTTPQS